MCRSEALDLSIPQRICSAYRSQYVPATMRRLAGGVRVVSYRRRLMFNAFGIAYGILAVVALIVLMDWLGRRKDRKSRDHAA
jgi:hypothetical protein